VKEDALEWVRIKAARDGAYERSMRAALKFQPLPFPTNRNYLSRDEANDRASLR